MSERWVDRIEPITNGHLLFDVVVLGLSCFVLGFATAVFVGAL